MSRPIRPIWICPATGSSRPESAPTGIDQVEKVWENVGFLEIGPGPDVSVLDRPPRADARAS